MTSTKTCKADIIWSDDFDEGNFNNWTIQDGNWSAEKEHLRVSERGGIYHPSSITVGTWSFDVYVAPVPDMHFSFYFMLDKPINTPIQGSTEFDSYYITIYAFPDGSPSTIDLKGTFGVYAATHEYLEIYEVGRDLSHQWHHIDITREEDGRILVYFNKELVIDHVDTRNDKSNFFEFMSYSGPAIDNIVVKDTVETFQINGWSEDFDDGDFDGWTEGLGEWAVINGTIQSQTPDTERPYCTLKRPSTIAYGTWSFDVKLQHGKALDIAFIDSNGTFATFGYWYELQILPRTGSAQFYFAKVEGDYSDTGETLTYHTVSEELHDAWHHIDISREHDGKFSIYLDSELLFEVVDNNINTSEVFVFTSHQYGAFIDNIEVRNTIDIIHPLRFEVSVEISDEVVSQGEEVLVTVQAVDDYGVIIPKISVDVLLDDELVDVSAVSWGEYQAVIDTSGLDGTIELLVSAEKVGFVFSESVHHFEVIAPASFVSSDLSIDPNSVQVGDAVEISVQVSNVGGLLGAHTVVLMVNEEVEDEFEVTLDPDGSETVIFEYSQTKSGNYIVDIGELSGSFTVKEQTIVETPSETETEPSGGIPAYPVWSIGVAILLVSLILYMKQRQ